MLNHIVELFFENRDKLKEELSRKHPEDYEDLVTILLKNISSPGIFKPDVSKMVMLGKDDYDGTLLFIIPTVDDEYYYVKIFYGSCSGCDTLYKIYDGGEPETPTETQVDDYMTLCMHIVQKLKHLDGEGV